MKSKKGGREKQKGGYTPVPFTRPHSSPKRLGEFNRGRNRREERDVKNGKWMEE